MSTSRMFLACCTAIVLAGCGGGEPFTYEDAMNLMRDRADSVRISFSAAPRFSDADAPLAKAYQKLLDGRIIQCKNTPALGVLCEPGPAGDALKQESPTDFSLVAGRWVPAAVVSLRRTGRDSASADMRMSFEPSATYREFEEALDLIQSPGNLAAQSVRRQGKLVHVVFQRYDDGWHVENVTE